MLVFGSRKWEGDELKVESEGEVRVKYLDEDQALPKAEPVPKWGFPNHLVVSVSSVLLMPISKTVNY